MDITVSTSAATRVTSPADHYAYSTPTTPTATALSSSSCGTGGDVLTITGTDLLGATGVSLDCTPAASFYVISATQVSTVAPPQTAGTIEVTVTAPAGTSATSSSDQFTYSASSSCTAVHCFGRCDRRAQASKDSRCIRPHAQSMPCFQHGCDRSVRYPHRVEHGA